MTESPTQSAPSVPAVEPRSKLTWSEQIEVSGEQLVAKIKALAAEGQVNKVRITEPDGDLVLEVPLTLGAIAGGAVVLAAPALAIIGAIAAFVTKVKVEVVRNGSGPDQA
jgi:hypothetical protein